MTVEGLGMLLRLGLGGFLGGMDLKIGRRSLGSWSGSGGSGWVLLD